MRAETIRIIIIISCLIYLLLCFFMYRFLAPPTYMNYIKSCVYKSKPPEWSNPKLNLPSSPNNLTGKTLYIAIIDTEYAPHPFQCLMKNQWVDELSKHWFIDKIEYFSRIRWTNKQCNITTIVTPHPKFKDTLNPTSWILVNTLKMFLERSKSPYLFIVGDSCYLKVNEFVDFFSKFNGRISGGCIEQRYFFQMLLIESGIIISRQTVMNFISDSAMKTWDVASEVGITADESFSQIGDQVGLYIKNYAENRFVGREFREYSDFDRLKNKRFEDLPPCTIPSVYINNPPGEQGICSSEITKFNQIISWSAFIPADPTKTTSYKSSLTDKLNFNSNSDNESESARNKYKFLKNARKMINNNPDYLSYYWAQSKPRLCKIDSSN